MAQQTQASASSVSQRSIEKLNCHNWKEFDTIFDIIDDNNDTMEYTEAELNRYFLSGHLKSIIKEEEEPMEYDMTNEHDNEEETTTGIILSQKLDQLSAKDDPNKNNIGGDDYDIDEYVRGKHELPKYLWTTNELFIHLVRIIHKANSKIKINDMQDIAILKHQINVVRIKKQIIETCLQSVIGKLTIVESDLIDVDRRVWPIKVQSLMSAYRKSSTKTMGAEKEDEQMICENLLHQKLKELAESVKQYETKLNHKQKSVIGYTSMIEEEIDNYVQQCGIESLERKGDYQIASIKYNYQAELLERKYTQEKPNEYEMQTAKRLLDAKRKAEKAKRDVYTLKQQVFYHELYLSKNQKTTSHANIQQLFVNEQEKLIYYKALDEDIERLKREENEYHRYQSTFDADLSRMWENHRKLVRNQGMRTTLITLIEQSLDNIHRQLKDIYNFQIDSYQRNSSSNTMNSSNLILTTNEHRLTNKQLQLLNRGPTYVPLCQMYVSSLFGSMDDIIKEQFSSFKHQLDKVFSDHHTTRTVTMELQRKIQDQFRNLFINSIPSDLQQQRAVYEKKLVQSIRCSLKKNNLILRRTADNMNTFFLGNRQEFESKAERYLRITTAYKFLMNKDSAINSNNYHEQMQYDFKVMIESMNVLIEKLRQQKSLDNDIVNKLILDPSKVKLPSIYFLPDVSKENEFSLVPFITSKHSATWKISELLNRTLEPFVENTLKSTTFRDGMDFIQKLNHYLSTERRLQSTTLFCSIKITNFYTLDTHENMIYTVDCFLQDHLRTNTLGPLTLKSIKHLLELFLFNNIFCYKEQVYTFTSGSPNTMPLSETLSNIYLSVWQKYILHPLVRNNEFFGRYKDEIFFTWNQSNALTLETFLQEEIREKHLNVRFNYSIGKQVDFLNALLENRNCQLYSRVYHHPTRQRYTLPYVIGHSKLAHSNWFQFALIRAVCYCSSVEDFHQERIYLELSFLHHGYSLTFVESHIRHFFLFFHMANMRYSSNPKDYEKFRYYWFDSMVLQHERSDQLRRFDNNGHLYHLNYIYEFGPRCQFNQEFYQLWSEYFKNHPNLSSNNLKLLLEPKHWHTLNSSLGMEK